MKKVEGTGFTTPEVQSSNPAPCVFYNLSQKVM